MVSFLVAVALVAFFVIVGMLCLALYLIGGYVESTDV